MSQVEIVLKAGAGYSESSLADADVSVKMNNLATSATVNLATFTVSANGSVRSLTPYMDGAVYRAFVVPQTATGNNLITITVDGADHKSRRPSPLSAASATRSPPRSARKAAD